MSRIQVIVQQIAHQIILVVMFPLYVMKFYDSNYILSVPYYVQYCEECSLKEFVVSLILHNPVSLIIAMYRLFAINNKDFAYVLDYCSQMPHYVIYVEGIIISFNMMIIAILFFV